MDLQFLQIAIFARSPEWHASNLWDQTQTWHNCHLGKTVPPSLESLLSSIILHINNPWWSPISDIKSNKKVTKRFKTWVKLTSVKIIYDKISPPVNCRGLAWSQRVLISTIRDHLSIVIIRDEDKNNAVTSILLTLPGKYIILWEVINLMIQC